ncbi:MAG: FtsH protease activity modulator HflK [Clostridiales bacterium]|nr:FtsH protease activity modulator HflK [Clostridiales bacterium]
MVGLIFLAIGLIFLFTLIGTCWYTVDEQETAVVTTFGRVTATNGAGIHFKIPFGIQKVKTVETNVYQKIEIGYATKEDGTYTSVESESKMITGDYNIVNVDFFVQYKISDPVKYLYNSANPDMILKNLVQSQIRSVIGSTNVDSVLTDGKTEIQIKVKDLITEILANYDIGLILTDVTIQDSEPPTETVTAAFKAVETAKQGAEKAINNAEAYQNAQIPAAQAKADSLKKNAEYLKQNRINEAVKAVAKFNAMYNEYVNNPDITRIRMYYETISKVLPDVKLYIITTNEKGVETLLPLDNFANNSGINNSGTNNKNTGEVAQ